MRKVLPLFFYFLYFSAFGAVVEEHLNMLALKLLSEIKMYPHFW